MIYYELTSDGRGDARWWLDTPRTRSGEEIDFWPLVDARRYADDQELVVPVEKPGRIDDIVLGPFDIPYLSPRAADVFASVCGDSIQLVRARASNRETVFILNLLAVCDCLDREGSQVGYTSAGVIHMVMDLKIRSEDVAVGCNAFRIKDWMMPIILSGLLADELKEKGLTGFSLVPV